MARVSPAGVSRVLSGAPGVSAHVRSSVETAIRDLGFHASPSTVTAPALLTVGLAVPGSSNEFFDAIASGIAQTLSEPRIQVVVAPARTDDESDGQESIEALRDIGTQAVVAVAPLLGREWLEAVGSEVPLVAIGRHDDSRYYDTISGDDRRGAMLVMNHLIGAGHRDIAYVTHEDFIIRRISETPHAHRLAAYEAAMRQAGLDRHARVLRCSAGEASAYGATREALTGGTPPTAIFAAHDVLAMGVLRAVAEAGLREGDVAVAGYDNTRMAEHPLISLTSVDQSGEKMGRRAGEMLLERLSGRRNPIHETLDPKLIVRRSSLQPS
mgnify:FL=1